MTIATVIKLFHCFTKSANKRTNNFMTCSIQTPKELTFSEMSQKFEIIIKTKIHLYRFIIPPNLVNLQNFITISCKPFEIWEPKDAATGLGLHTHFYVLLATSSSHTLYYQVIQWLLQINLWKLFWFNKKNQHVYHFYTNTIAPTYECYSMNQ